MLWCSWHGKGHPSALHAFKYRHIHWQSGICVQTSEQSEKIFYITEITLFCYPNQSHSIKCHNFFTSTAFLEYFVAKTEHELLNMSTTSGCSIVILIHCMYHRQRLCTHEWNMKAAYILLSVNNKYDQQINLFI